MRRRTALAMAVLLATSLGCGNDPESPSEPVNPHASVAATSAALAFWQVSAGPNHTCAVTTDNRAYCWGFNGGGGGRLGTGTGDDAYAPTAVYGNLTFRQVHAFSEHSCGVTTDNRAYCWGRNDWGQLGDGTTTWSQVPVAVAGGLSFRNVGQGNGNQTCGITTLNRLYCWGWNFEGELGDGTTLERHTPVAVAGGRKYQQVTTGTEHTCAVTISNVAFCWGRNEYGQLGDSTNVARRLVPTRVAGGHQFRQVTAGFYYTCAVTTVDRAYCWGDGPLGSGKSAVTVSHWPKAVAGGLTFRRVTAGINHTCAETLGSQAYCWGFNDEGELGNGTTTPHVTPVAVKGGIPFAQLSAGMAHTCGKTKANALYCWGWNSVGTLGDGTSTNRLVPTPVAGGT